jgi:hypothetical protein
LSADRSGLRRSVDSISSLGVSRFELYMGQVIKECTHGSRIYKCRECKKIYGLRRRTVDRAKYIWNVAKHRARKRGIPFTIRQEDIIIPDKCIVLGIPLDSRNRDYNPTIDEIVQGRGYVPGNFAVISGRANRIKSDATLLELKAITLYVDLRTKAQTPRDSW